MSDIPCIDIPCFDTLLARAGVDADPTHRAVMPPLYLSSNYAFDGFDRKRPYDYTRSGNPTRDVLGEALAGLEGGAGAVVTATGMAAVDLPLNLLKPGQRLIAPHDCYGGTCRLLNARARQGRFELVFVDQTDFEALDAALAQGAAMILIETPSNPLLRITDVVEVARRARAAGAVVVADNTFLSPVLQQPIALGADIVVHSTTKYINGHSDVVGGAVIAATQALHDELAWWANATGVTGAPFDAWLTLRGLRTLSVRIQRAQATAGRVAQALAAHPAVARVHYPGLADHPGHALAARQQAGFGAMLSFDLAGGVEAARGLCEGLSVFTLAESLGGVESLVAHPATMTHAAMTPDQRALAGVGDGLIRLSIGLEHEDDLIADLIAALDAASLRQAA